MSDQGLGLKVPVGTPMVFPGAVQYDVASRITGRTYRVFVGKPRVSPPPSGYPLLLTTDGNLTFPLAATMEAAFELGGQAALIVGVGYPSDDPRKLAALRTRDLTPPTPLSALPQRQGQPPLSPDDFGGSESFYRFLIEELRPAIARAYAVSAEDQTLYGHSWGGLFTLDVLLKHPGSFRGFVASSPSIWWNNRSVLEHVPDFVEAVTAHKAAPRVLILVGSGEQDVPHQLPPGIAAEMKKRIPLVPPGVRNAIGRAAMKRMMRDWRMVDNARSLAESLGELHGGRGYAVTFHAFDGDDHVTALSSSIGRALAFVLRQ